MNVDDRAWFDDLYNHAQADVYRFVLFRVGSRTVAEDLTAEAFTRAFAARHSFDSALGTPKSWVLGIAHRVMQRHYRDRERQGRAYARHGVRSASDDWSEQVSVDKVTVESAKDHVRMALERLPEHLREVLVLAAHPDIDRSQMSDILGVAEGTVKSRLSRARTRFRAELDVLAGNELTDRG